MSTTSRIQVNATRVARFGVGGGAARNCFSCSTQRRKAVEPSRSSPHTAGTERFLSKPITSYLLDGLIRFQPLLIVTGSRP